MGFCSRSLSWYYLLGVYTEWAVLTSALQSVAGARFSLYGWRWPVEEPTTAIDLLPLLLRLWSIRLSRWGLALNHPPPSLPPIPIQDASWIFPPTFHSPHYHPRSEASSLMRGVRQRWHRWGSRWWYRLKRRCNFFAKRSEMWGNADYYGTLWVPIIIVVYFHTHIYIGRDSPPYSFNIFFILLLSSIQQSYSLSYAIDLIS